MCTPRIWLGGWGVSPAETARRLPADDIIAHPPTEAALETVLNTPKDTPLGGWSLGAHLLLRAIAKRDPRTDGRRITLVCPFLAFPAEASAGGRIPLTAVKYLRKWLSRAPDEALGDFYQRAGLDLPAPGGLPYPAEALSEGFMALESPTVPPIRTPLPEEVTVWLGERDALLDPERLAALLPGAHIVPGAGHDLRDFAEVLR